MTQTRKIPWVDWRSLKDAMAEESREEREEHEGEPDPGTRESMLGYFPPHLDSRIDEMRGK